jgi:hypothetical protein
MYVVPHAFVSTVNIRKAQESGKVILEVFGERKSVRGIVQTVLSSSITRVQVSERIKEKEIQ